MSTYFYSNVIWLQSGPKISTLVISEKYKIQKFVKLPHRLQKLVHLQQHPRPLQHLRPRPHPLQP